MMHMLTVIPPIQKSMMTSSDAAFWVMIGLLVVLALVATVLWFVGNWRIAQRPPQVKEAGHQYETLLPLYNMGDEQHPNHPKHEEEVLLRR